MVQETEQLEELTNSNILTLALLSTAMIRFGEIWKELEKMKKMSLI
jgi:glycerol-3-phosphate responsive antiterminator